MENRIPSVRKRLLDRARALRMEGNLGDATLMSLAASLISDKNRLFSMSRKDVESRYLGGEGLRSISEDIGCSAPTLRRYLRESGIEIRAPGSPGISKLHGSYRQINGAATERYGRMATMRRNGATLETIGKEFHITKERVRQILADRRFAEQEKNDRKAA